MQSVMNDNPDTSSKELINRRLSTDVNLMQSQLHVDNFQTNYRDSWFFTKPFYFFSRHLFNNVKKNGGILSEEHLETMTENDNETKQYGEAFKLLINLKITKTKLKGK